MHSMKSCYAEHKSRPEDMLGLARTYMGQEVQAYYLDAKYMGTLPEEWEEVKETLQLCYVQCDHKVRVELQFDALKQRSTSRHTWRSSRRWMWPSP